MKRYEIRIYENNNLSHRLDFDETILNPELRKLILRLLREQMTKNEITTK